MAHAHHTPTPTIQEKYLCDIFFSGSQTPYSVCSFSDDITVHRQLRTTIIQNSIEHKIVFLYFSLVLSHFLRANTQRQKKNKTRKIIQRPIVVSFWLTKKKKKKTETKINLRFVLRKTEHIPKIPWNKSSLVPPFVQLIIVPGGGGCYIAASWLKLCSFVVDVKIPCILVHRISIRENQHSTFHRKMFQYGYLMIFGFAITASNHLVRTRTNSFLCKHLLCASRELSFNFSFLYFYILLYFSILRLNLNFSLLLSSHFSSPWILFTIIYT